MKIPITILLSFLFLISCSSQKVNPEYTASCTVSNSLALCKIPISPQRMYKYFKKSTPDNVSGYDCIISLGQYQFGYNLFKYSGSKEQTGNIEEVISSGETTIWLIEGNSFSAVTGHGLSINYSAPYIVMKIENPLTINLLFREHPSKCSFRIRGFIAPKYDGEIEIQYKDF